MTETTETTVPVAEPVKAPTKPAAKPRTRGKAKPKTEAKAKLSAKTENVSENFVVLVDDTGIASIAPVNWVGPPQMRFPATRISELHGLLGDFLEG